MRGINVQKIVIEREENEKLYKALDILKEFNDKFADTIDEAGLNYIDEFDNLGCVISHITNDLEDFLDDLGFCENIEIKG
jgi:hypothetical protein